MRRIFYPSQPQAGIRKTGAPPCLRGYKVLTCGGCCMRGINDLEEEEREKRAESAGSDQALPRLRLAGTGREEVPEESDRRHQG